MSTAVVVPNEVVDPPEVVREKAGVERTAELLVEYKKKVRSVNKRFEVATELHRQVKRFRPVIVAAESLARYASGLVENARLPQIDKIELQLRNAELEAELIEAKRFTG